MFKRLSIGLVAVVLVTIFVAESANAIAIRLRRSVDSIHQCPIDGIDTCPGSVRDILYGAELLTTIITQGACEDGGYLWKPEDTVVDAEGGAVITVAAGCYRPTCIIKGTYECITANSCLEPVPNETIGITEDSFESTADFIQGKATNVGAFNEIEGEELCADGESLYNVKPDAVIGFTTYYSDTGGLGNVLGRYIDVCPIFYKDTELEDQYNCTVAWDDFSTAQSGVRPPLPCCSEVGLLSVSVVGQGTVTSNPSGIIDCDEDNSNGESDYCDQYDNNDLSLNDPNALNGCPTPLITLTASADPGWEFTGWSDACTNTGDCIVTAEQGYGSVTATFKETPAIKVTIDGGDDNDRVRIFAPVNLNYTQPEGTDICTTFDSPCTIQLAIGDVVTFKKQGDSITWGGACEGVPNSADTCTVTVVDDNTQNEVTVYFDEK
jgi:hypothetical protein